MSLAPKPGPGRSGFRPATTVATAPATRPLAESLTGNGSLGGLLARVRQSEARLQDLRGIVPAELLARLRAGPLDDDGWTLLAANSAVAAKMRHLLPLIAEGLRDKGWGEAPVRVRVHVPD